MLLVILSTITVFAGLAAVGFGGYLAKIDKVAGALTLSLAGLALVVLGGPTAARLAKLAISSEGLEVAYDIQPATAATSLQDEQRTIASISAVIGAPSSSSQAESGQDSQDESAAKSFYDYIRSIGYIPSALVGSGVIEPGSIVIFQQGLPVLWATQREAYPEVVIGRAPSGLGDYNARFQDASKRSDLKIACDGGSVATASQNSLKVGSAEVLGRFEKDQDYYVITEVIACEKLDISETTYLGAEGAEVQGTRLNYSSPQRVVVGYHLAQIQVSSTSEPGSTQ